MLKFGHNMNFRQRFLRYLIGVSIGMTMVYFMFPNYDWLGWLPKKQVKEELLKKPLVLDSMSLCKMNCYHISNAQLDLARAEGSIDFNLSRVKETPRVYRLLYGELGFDIAILDSTTLLKDIIHPTQTCQCP